MRPAEARRRPRIVSLGDLIVDVVASASGPLASGSDRAGTIAFRQGGSAANTARWVASCGGEAVFIGAVGRDEWGHRLGAALTNAGVEVHLATKNAPTARIVVLVDADGERTDGIDRQLIEASSGHRHEATPGQGRGCPAGGPAYDSRRPWTLGCDPPKPDVDPGS